MWLLNTKTLKIKDYVGIIPPYAILSHTWSDEEVSFQTIDQQVAAHHTQGYKKIERSCGLARSQGHEYIWIDTCCIDKKSSAELSEAINSMYTWYSNAVVCYVFMYDVACGPRAVGKEQDFVHSRWFTRGWTLQELLAPEKVKFYNRDWDYIGNKHDMLELVSQATGIESSYITNRRLIRRASVAARMAWASMRKTTRLEDEAYCLMGLFDVNMPLLYGEGSKAFLRLQHEIVKDSHDESLFAWHSTATHSGMFAPNAFAFRGCEDVQTLWEDSSDLEQWTYVKEAPTITNRGLRIEMRLQQISFASINGHTAALGEGARYYEYFVVVLTCAHRARMDRPIAILLRQFSGNLYMRFLPSEIMVFEKYYPGRVFDKKKHKTQSTRTIYVQDPLKLNLREGAILRDGRESSIYTDVVIPSLSILSNYHLDVVYISPPGVIQSGQDFGNGWLIQFHGWSGIAMIRLKDHDDHCLLITIKNVHSGDAGRCISLEPVSCDEQKDTLEELCYANRDILQPMKRPIRISSCRHNVETHLERPIRVKCGNSLYKNEHMLRIVEPTIRHSLSVRKSSQTASISWTTGGSLI